MLALFPLIGHKHKVWKTLTQVKTLIFHVRNLRLIEMEFSESTCYVLETPKLVTELSLECKALDNSKETKTFQVIWTSYWTSELNSLCIKEYNIHLVEIISKNV